MMTLVGLGVYRECAAAVVQLRKSREEVPLTVAVLAGALTPARTIAADQPWIRAVTPNLELYTTDSEGTARDTLPYFEQIRAFFVRVLGEICG